MTVYSGTGGSLLSQHAAHVLAIGIPAVMVVVGLTWDSWRRRMRGAREVLPATPALAVAVLACAGAAAVHVAVIPEHFRESVLYGAFFVLAAVGQLGGAVVLAVSRSRVFAVLVAAGNASIVLLWVVTRVAGIPLGPDTGVVEPAQVLDVLATTCELVVVSCCLMAAHRVVRVVRSVPAL
jgi:hypothetical protein